MLKLTRNFVWLILIASFFFVAPQTFAKKDASPAGWEKGEKKGWNGGEMPPGLAKKVKKEAKELKEETA